MHSAKTITAPAPRSDQISRERAAGAELVNLARIPPLLKLGKKSSMEGAMKLSLNVLDLVKELDIRTMFVAELVNTAYVATKAKMMGISVPDANMLRREALDYAKKFGDFHVNLYNKAT